MKTKHLGLIFTLLLIFIGIICVVIAISGGVLNENYKFYETESFVKELTDDNITSVNIDFSYGSLIFKDSDVFKIDAQNVKKDSLIYEVKNGIFTVKSKKSWLMNINFDFNCTDNDNQTKLIVYLPIDREYKNFSVSSGAGECILTDIKTDNLSFDLGAGDVKIENISANSAKIDTGVGDVNLLDVNFDSLNIDAGVGEVNIRNANLKDLDLDAGVGKVSIEGVLKGNCKLDGGVGEIDIDLLGNIQDYSFDVDTGVGEVKINGIKYGDTKEQGKENHFDIDVGVGEININIGG